MKVFVVILAGGKGERFWPKSREAMPKQFIKLTDNGTMLQLTFNRARKITSEENIYVVTGTVYADLVAQQLPEMPRKNIIAEPEGRNTAPCIGLTAVLLEAQDPEGVMVVLPADHYIAQEDKFNDVLEMGVRLAAEKNFFVTLGILPTRPETGYGYIELGPQSNCYGQRYHEALSFKEKPDYETAQRYLGLGNFYWNSGMFIWQVKALLEEIKQHQPELTKGLNCLREAMKKETLQQELPVIYSRLPKQSIDYALLEKVDNILVIPCDFGWDDVGSWAALPRVFQVDGEGNYLQGSVVTMGAHNCIIDGKTKLIAAVGVEDLVVVDTDDVILICPRDRSQDVKLLLEQLRKQNMEKYL